MSAPRRFKLWPVMILALLLAGCAVGPGYKRPAVNAPQNFRGDTTGLTNSLGDMPWWELFHDEELQALIRSALTNNYDVRIAAARVEQARARGAQLEPMVASSTMSVLDSNPPTSPCTPSIGKSLPSLPCLFPYPRPAHILRQSYIHPLCWTHQLFLVDKR